MRRGDLRIAAREAEHGDGTVFRRMLGGMDVLLRYAMEDGPLIEGDPLLCHFGEDSRIEALPIFELCEARWLEAAA